MAPKASVSKRLSACVFITVTYPCRFHFASCLHMCDSYSKCCGRTLGLVGVTLMECRCASRITELRGWRWKPARAGIIQKKWDGKLEAWFEATKRKLLQSKCHLPSKMSLFHGATVTSYNFGRWIILKGTQPNSTSDPILINKKTKTSWCVELEEVSLQYVS